MGKVEQAKKSKRAKKSKAERDAPLPTALLPESEATPPWLDGDRPPGQRFYDMPYSSPSPRLINPDLGLHNLMSRAGHNAAYNIDVTLLDAPDHRLIRSGVLLAHRVLDGRGEWFLTAPDWQPLLPKDRIELMGHAELPDELADLIRPLRRRATLGPVAGLRCERREFALRDDHGTTMALLRDDKVTVRRGGLTTARYRQVMITPVGPGLTEEQKAWVDRALTQSGANRIPKFPRLVTRLGAPATGPTDIPEPAPFDPEAPFRKFVSQLMALRLRHIVEADLAIRGGDLTAAAALADEAAQLRLELKGLSFVLDADWIEDLYDELDWIIVEAEPGTDGDPAPHRHLVARLRSERYLTLLERLVNAVRSPKLADAPSISHPGAHPTSEVLAELITTAVNNLRRSADPLTVDSSDHAWLDAYRALAQLQWVADLTGHILSDRTRQLSERLAKPQRLLAAVRDAQVETEQALAAVAELDPAAAFEAGRAFEQRAVTTRSLRQEFVDQWAKSKKKLDG